MIPTSVVDHYPAQQRRNQGQVSSIIAKQGLGHKIQLALISFYSVVIVDFLPSWVIFCLCGSPTHLFALSAWGWLLMVPRHYVPPWLRTTYTRHTEWVFEEWVRKRYVCVYVQVCIETKTTALFLLALPLQKKRPFDHSIIFGYD